MSNTLRYYRSAKREIGFNAFPQRKQNGEFKFTPEQEAILTETKFKSIRKGDDEITQLAKRKQDIKQEMLVYQNPSGKLAAEGKQRAENLQPEIDDVEMRLKDLKQEQDQETSDMLKLGKAIPEQIETVEKFKKEKKSKGFLTIKMILSFLGEWLIGEIFFSYTQWNSLRNEKGIEDMLVRSLSFGVILFLTHLVAHYYRNRRHLVYPVFICFSLFMLIIMLFVPLIINKVYPEGNNLPTIAEQWKLTDTDTARTVVGNPNPIWVDVYRDNETIPAILCFIFFVAMKSFLGAKKKVEENTLEPEQKIETEEEKEAAIMAYRAKKIQETEIRLKDLKARQQDELDEKTGGLQAILSKLEAMETECIEIDRRIAALKTEKEELLKDLEKELNEYSVIFSEVLKNDELKSPLVAIEWQTRQDILNYYKIKAE